MKVVTSGMEWNGADGLNVFAGGSVLLAEVNASHNTGMGASVTAGGNVTVNGGMYSDNTGDGLSITSGGDALVFCSLIVGNGGYGVDATLPGVLTTRGETIYDNTAGDVNVAGGGTWEQVFANCEGWPHVDTSGLPWVVLHVTSGDAQPLDCSIYGGTVLILPNWDHVAIPCPIAGDASLTSVDTDRLPGELGENYTYVSGPGGPGEAVVGRHHHGGLPDAAGRIRLEPDHPALGWVAVGGPGRRGNEGQVLRDHVSRGGRLRAGEPVERQSTLLEFRGMADRHPSSFE